MKLSPIQRYNLNYCLNFFLKKAQLQPLVEILKEVLNESQTRVELKKNILALIYLSLTEGLVKQFSYYMLANFLIDVNPDIYEEIVRETGAECLRLTAGEHDVLLTQLKAQKFLPALPDKEAAILGYAPAQLKLGKQYRYGAGYDKKKAREYFMQAFEQGIHDDESFYEYTHCFYDNSYHHKLTGRRCYLWEILIEHNCQFSSYADYFLNIQTCGFYDLNEDGLKTFQQLLHEATVVHKFQIVDPKNTKGSVTVVSFGEPYAQALVGFCYHIGLGVERNVTKAIEFYKLSRDPDVFWDLLFCFKQQLLKGSMEIRDVLHFYEQYLYGHSWCENHKIPAYLVLANVYYDGIMGFVFPNPIKAYEYYSQALKLTSTNTVKWEEENKLAEEGIRNTQPLVARRDQILSSLALHGITLPLCNLVAEYTYDNSLPEPLVFSTKKTEINSAFSCMDTKQHVEENAISQIRPVFHTVMEKLS